MTQNKDIDIVCDIDGCLCNNNNGDYVNATPIPIGIENVNKMYDEGYHVVLFTARYGKRFPGQQYQKGYEETLTWLRQNGVKFHELIMGKPAGHVYIDDKAIRIDVENREKDWATCWEEIESNKNKNYYGQKLQ
jgi:hypothetical protein